MIPESKFHTLQALITGSTREEIIWINGYISGLVNGHVAGSNNGVQHKPETPTVQRISIIYGTETGNSKKLALQFTALSKQNKLAVRCTSLDQYDPRSLEKEEYLFIVISTQGEGEPPEAAKTFMDHLFSTREKLPHLKYGVLGLGDSAYPLFCKTGEDVDGRLEALGAKRLFPLVKCDTDFETPAKEWFESVLSVLKTKSPEHSTRPQTDENPTVKKSKKQIRGVISRNINLNDHGSNKQTFHIEIRTDEELDYQPGDSIAVVPCNREQVVNGILSLGQSAGEAELKTPKFSGTLRELLTHRLGICYLMINTIRKYAELTGHEIPDTRMDFIDLLRIYPCRDSDQFLRAVELLNPMAPRLYSVSSSTSSDPREVHVTVSRHRFLKEDEQHFGLCSSFLGDLPVDSPLEFYVHRNRSFKLPEENRDIIMVGPGTGIAPFRSFMQERDLQGHTGRSWLFFGEQHFISDFLYQTEIQQYLQTGVLNKLNLAFSRDGQEKTYVQDRMREEGAELFSWLEGGASFYVSGTKDPMSLEVENTLVDIVAEHGKMNPEAAGAYLAELKKNGRYLKDVY